MVKQSGPDDSVDLFHAESFRELAQGKHCRVLVFDGPIAERKSLNSPELNLSVLPPGKGALHCAELRDAKLLCEVRVEHDLRTPGIDEESYFLAAVYAHVQHGERISLYKLPP